MSEEQDRIKREADWQRLANIEQNLAINTLTTTRIENTLNDLNKKLDKYPVIVEKVWQHDKWIIGGFIGMVVLGLQAVWGWITKG